MSAPTRSLILRAEEVRRVLAAGVVTVCRPVRPQPPPGIVSLYCDDSDELERHDVWQYQVPETDQGITYNAVHVLGNGSCPFGAPGSERWCKETWQIIPSPSGGGWNYYVAYRATDDDVPDTSSRFVGEWLCGPKRWKNVPDWVDSVSRDKILASPLRHGWRPSNHMPRRASRLDLGLTDVGCKQVQEITDAEAVGAGFSAERGDGTHTADYPCAQGLFRTAWNNRYADRAWKTLDDLKRGIGWDGNPWTWIGAYKRVTP